MTTRRTRSTSKQNGSRDIDRAKVSKVVRKSPNPKLASPKTYFEDTLDHIQIPSDYSLPAHFVEAHTSEFIEGVRYIIAKDPSLYRVILHKYFNPFKKTEMIPKDIDKKEMLLTYWYALIRSVIGQQISGKAQQSIEKKFRDLFEDKPTPQAMLSKSEEELRSAGFSYQKIKYITHISQVFNDPNSDLTKIEFYESNPIDKIISELTSLKGIGVWSAKMFALFTLKNLNLFAYDDLGIARGVTRYFSRRPQYLEELKKRVDADESKKLLLKKKSTFSSSKGKRDWVPHHDEYVKALGMDFSPFQLILMLIFWRLGSTNIEVFQGKESDAEQPVDFSQS